MAMECGRRVVRALTFAVCALSVQAAVATAGGSSRDDRAQQRCARAIEREGLRLETQRSWGLMNCLRGLSECKAAGQDLKSRNCSSATRFCSAVAANMVSDAARERSRIVEACSDMPMARVKDTLGYGLMIGDCQATAIGGLVDCLNNRLVKSEGDVVGLLKPMGCALLAEAGLAGRFPELVCSPGSACKPCDPCPPPSSEGKSCGGPTDVACAEGFVCDRTDPLCTSHAAGSCVARPESCVDDGHPVCGCDATTYSSDCARLRAGVAVSHSSSCDPAPSTCGLDGVECLPGSFCDFPTGVCGEGAGGVCRPMRAEPCNMCSAFVDGPVCGCDNVTYASDCERQAAGIAKYYVGACVF